MRMHSDTRLVALVCCSLFSLVVCATSVRAQAIHEGKLTGTVASEDQAVMPGATVEISSPALLGGTKSAVTSDERQLRISQPAARPLHGHRRRMSGFKTVVRENIEVSADATVTLDFVLPVGSSQGDGDGQRRSPLVDAKSATIDSRIDSELLAKLPTSRDAFYDLALTAPGMFEGSGSPSSDDAVPEPDGLRQRDQRERVPDQRRQRDQSRGRDRSARWSTSTTTRSRKCAIVGLGIEGRVRQLLGRGDRRDDQVRQQRSSTAAARSTRLLGSPAEQPARTSSDDLGAPWLFVGEGEQLAGETKKDWEGSGTARRSDRARTSCGSSARSTTCAARACRRAGRCENESWNRYADGKISAVPFKNHLRLGLVPLREQRRQRLELGIRARVGHHDDLRVEDEEPHRRGAVAVVSPTGHDCRERQVPGVLEGRKPYLPRDPPDHPGYINWWKWADYGINGAFPYVDAQKASRQTVQADLSHYAEGFLGSARHQVRRPVHEGARQPAGRLLPELRQLPLSVPLDAERRRTCRTGTATTGCSSTTTRTRSIRS